VVGSKDIVIFGSGSREACLAEAFLGSDYHVGNITTDANQTLINAEGAYLLGNLHSNTTRALDSVERLQPEVVVIQEEALLFQGLASHLRQQGLRVFGADTGPSMLERDKASTRDMIKKRFPNLLPNLLLMTSDPSDLDCHALPEKYAVRTHLVKGAGTTVLVQDSESKQRASELIRNGPVLVEEFVEGIPLTYYVFADNNKRIHIAPPLRTYPFRFNGDEGDKTGGMGCSAEQRADTHFTKATEVVDLLASYIIPRMTQHGDYLQCFSIEVIANDSGVVYIESDARLGDPEVCLLSALMGQGELGRLLLSLNSESMVSPRYAHTCGLSVVLTPFDYPNVHQEIIADGSWIDRLKQRGGKLHLGRVKRRQDDLLEISRSRTGVYTRAGPVLSAARSTVYTDLRSVALPSPLSFRGDVGGN
jgi:phosphoribosylamine--glycine ligase